MSAIWDTLGFLFAAFWLGAFAFWLFGYFAVEAFKHVFLGPSAQFSSLETSVLDSEPLPGSASLASQDMVSEGAPDDQRRAA